MTPQRGLPGGGGGYIPLAREDCDLSVPCSVSS